MKNFKKIMFLFALCSFLFTMYTIQDTFAKYRTDATAQTDITIARWQILVNNQDIKDQADFSTTISPIFNGDSNTASGVIVPGAEGYFDVVINGTNADVSFNYNLDITVSENSDVQDLIITKYTINNGPETEFLNNYNINNNILYSDVNKTKTFRFFVKWDDTESATMNNQADTQASGGNATFDIDLRFVQIANQ